jgi:TPR repeat protein
MPATPLALDYFKGEGVPVDEPRAATLFEKSCEQRIGAPARGAALLRRSCDLGSKPGCDALAPSRKR